MGPLNFPFAPFSSKMYGPLQVLMALVHISLYSLPDVVRGQHWSPHQVSVQSLHSFRNASHSLRFDIILSSSQLLCFGFSYHCKLSLGSPSPLLFSKWLTYIVSPSWLYCYPIPKILVAGRTWLYIAFFFCLGRRKSLLFPHLLLFLPVPFSFH